VKNRSQLFSTKATHFKVQDSRKYITQIQMKVIYYLKNFFGLPFLDSDNVIHYFTDDFLAIFPAKDDRDVQFTDYVFENYISPDAMFPSNI
jgi:hypothetical protein